MTNFYGLFSPTEVGDGYPGAAPVPGAGNLMQGNPNVEPSGVMTQPPANQNAPQILAGTQISSGNISLNSVPTNVLSAPGTDSLLAQMSRGQVILKDTTYGMSQFIPANGGTSNSYQATISPVVTGPASGLTYPAVGSSQNYTGN
jgi:hypothetical protein